MSLRGCAAVASVVILILVLTGAGGVHAHPHPPGGCEVEEWEFLTSAMAPLVGAPGSSAFNLHNGVFLQIESEVLGASLGEWRVQVVHAQKGVVVENHLLGVSTSGIVLGVQELLHDEMHDPPSGDYTVEFSHLGAVQQLKTTMTIVRCP